jgi:triacylglycerol lipase
MTVCVPVICANAAALAYAESVELQEGAFRSGFSSADQFVVRNHSVTIFKHEMGTVVAFRGTKTWRDWKFNLSLIPTRRTWGVLHKGFARAAEALWPQIESIISEAGASGEKITFTGHSLGGAMAVVSALKAHYELNVPVSGIVTFGQPPLATMSIQASLQESGINHYLRFVNSVDVVVTGPFFPYRHVGKINYFDSDGNLHRNMSWIRFFRDAAVIGYRKLNPAGQVTSHFMAPYIRLLEQHVTSHSKKRIAGDPFEG